MTPSLQCTGCKTPVTPDAFNRSGAVPCPACAAPLLVEVFPALFRPLTPGQEAERVIIEGESSCFYHPEKKATVPCHGCGRFLCALCDCELRGEHFCPACLETGRKKGKIKNLENERTLYDSIALSLAIYPMLIFYFTLITAPMALYIAIRYWNAPRSIVHRTKIRHVAAILLAGIQLAAWGVGAYFLIRGLRMANG